jgi:hypothetical protein
LRLIKFEFEQQNSQLKLKLEQCKSLQQQLETFKRKSQTDFKRQLEQYESRLQFLKHKNEELKCDVEQKNYMLQELKH